MDTILNHQRVSQVQNDKTHKHIRNTYASDREFKMSGA